MSDAQPVTRDVRQVPVHRGQSVRLVDAPADSFAARNLNDEQVYRVGSVGRDHVGLWRVRLMEKPGFSFLRDMFEVVTTVENPDYTGIVGERQKMRAQLAKYAWKAPSFSECSVSRITVNCKTGERTVEKIEPSKPLGAIEEKPLPPSPAERCAASDAERRATEWRIKDLYRRNMQSGGPEVSAVFAAVTEATGVSAQDLVGPRRAKHLFQPRFVVYWLLVKLRGDLSLPAIGRAMNRDHSSIKHGFEKLELNQNTPPYKDWLAHPAIVRLVEGER
jgi:hypothetical protein